MNADHETVNVKPLQARDPRTAKNHDARRRLNALRARARHAKNAPARIAVTTPLDAPDAIARHTKIDSAWQVKRSLTRKRIRATGKMLSRWWKRYSAGWKRWMEDRIDINDGEAE